MSDEMVSKYFKNLARSTSDGSPGLSKEGSNKVLHNSPARSDHSRATIPSMTPTGRAARSSHQEDDWRSDTDSEDERSSQVDQRHHRQGDSIPFASVSQTTAQAENFLPSSAISTTKVASNLATPSKQPVRDFTTPVKAVHSNLTNTLAHGFAYDESHPTMPKRRAEESPERIVRKDGQGPSQGAGALDSRARLNQEREYQKRIAPYVDGKIRDEVEKEGGITPGGRLFKALLRMFEEGKIVAVEEDEGGEEAPEAEIARLREELSQLKKKLENVKKALAD